MSPKFDDIQKMGKDQMQVASTAASSVASGFQALATEASDYSKKVFENGTAFVEKLLSVKSFESAIQIQTDYARSSYETFVAQTSKVGDICGAMVKDVFKPVETAMTKVQTAA